MSRTHTAFLPSGLVITFPPVKIRHLISLQGIDRRDLSAQSAWMAEVCSMTLDAVLDLARDDWQALSRAITATLAPTQEDAAPLGDGPAQPASAAR